ncbi:GNAT family N-acetyltransferase [Saccharicrinis aurantiacus]|uniref:GNAT family N-acetyltransferase n=1 Tax=Saccharicrinis aurantiacus TaxID=1849719 RepID=UPI000837EBA9|nr:GNAT family N-acetyltransferase [Saccharicrinis aurantiacus]
MNPTTAIDKNFNLHIKHLPAQKTFLQVFEREGLTYIDSGLVVDTYNVIHITDASTVSKDTIEEAVNFYDNRLRKSCIWIEKDKLNKSLLQIFSELNITHSATNEGMSAPVNVLTEGELNPNIVPAYNKQAIIDHAFIIANNWEPFDTNVLKYYNTLAETILDDDNLVLLNYLHDSVPSGAIELFIEPENPKSAGIYNLSVMKEDRNQGIATALVKHTIALAKERGIEQIHLQASDDSKGIFSKMGFKQAGEFMEYALDASY